MSLLVITRPQALGHFSENRVTRGREKRPLPSPRRSPLGVEWLAFVILGIVRARGVGPVTQVVATQVDGQHDHEDREA